MNNAMISSQILGLAREQQPGTQLPRANQNQGLWQQQLEQASLWQTNLAITVFKSPYTLLQSVSQQAIHSNISPRTSASPLIEYTQAPVLPSAEELAQTAVAKGTGRIVPHRTNSQGQGNIHGEALQNSDEAKVVADKTVATLALSRHRILLTQTWQKQHVFLSEFEGARQLWIRDSAVTKGMTGKLATSLLGSMAQLGVELSSVVVNGQLVFAKNQEIKE